MTVGIDKDFLLWYKEVFPEGTLWLTINGLLKSFKDVYEANPPADYAKLGAEQLATLLNDE